MACFYGTIKAEKSLVPAAKATFLHVDTFKMQKAPDKSQVLFCKKNRGGDHEWEKSDSGCAQAYSRRTVGRGQSFRKGKGFPELCKKKIKENPELVDDIIDMLTRKILDEGDLKALEILIDLAGESPRQQEISLKKQELKLKKENAENQSW